MANMGAKLGTHEAPVRLLQECATSQPRHPIISSAMRSSSSRSNGNGRVTVTVIKQQRAARPM